MSRWLHAEAWRSSLSLIVTAAVVVALVVAALLTVRSAGCSEPRRLVTRGDGVIEVHGGCIAAGDLVAPGTPLSTAPHVVPSNDHP